MYVIFIMYNTSDDSLPTISWGLQNAQLHFEISEIMKNATDNVHYLLSSVCSVTTGQTNFQASLYLAALEMHVTFAQRIG